MELFSKEVLRIAEELNMRGENLWLEFVQSFRLEAISFLNHTQKTKWEDILRSNGVKVRKGKGIRKERALWECLSADSFNDLQGIIDLVENQPSHSSSSQVNSNDRNDNENELRRIQPGRNADRGTSDNARPLGISGISRAYQHMEKFSGGMDEDLNNSLEIHEAGLVD